MIKWKFVVIRVKLCYKNKSIIVYYNICYIVLFSICILLLYIIFIKIKYDINSCIIFLVISYVFNVLK